MFRSSGFWENLHKGVDFNSFKYTMDHIGVVVGEPFSLDLIVKFEDKEASYLISEGASKDNPALAVQSF